MNSKYRDIKIAYLGTPYTHPDLRVREKRTVLADQIAAELMMRGLAVFSPITHGHEVTDHLSETHRISHNFWMEQCLPMVRRSDIFIILPQSGWRESRGLKDEIDCCREYGVPIFVYQDPADIELELLDEEELEFMNWKVIPDNVLDLTNFLDQPTGKL